MTLVNGLTSEEMVLPPLRQEAKQDEKVLSER